MNVSGEAFLREMYAPVVASGVLTEEEARDAITLILSVNERVALGAMSDAQADEALRALAIVQAQRRRGHDSED